jgi:hypothetical protein
MAIARRHGVPCARLGVTDGETVSFRGKGFAFSLAVTTVRETWATALSRLLA